MPYRVLLSVEDNDSEYYIIKMSVEELKIPVQLHRVSDGEQALWFLEKIHGYELAPRPDLIQNNFEQSLTSKLDLRSLINA